MEELYNQYLELGPMRNAAAQQKQDAAEYKAAGRAMKEYIIMGGEVSDGIKDIEGVYRADPYGYELLVSRSKNEPEEKARLADAGTDDYTHARR